MAKKLIRMDVHPPPEMCAAIDRWRGGQPGVPARAVAARMLIEIGLRAVAEDVANVPAKPAKQKGTAAK